MNKLTLKKKPFLTLKKKPFLTLKKTAAVAAVLLSLTACGEPASSDLVLGPVNNAADAIEMCKTLPEDLIQDCFTATVNTDW